MRFLHGINGRGHALMRHLWWFSSHVLVLISVVHEVTLGWTKLKLNPNASHLRAPP